MKNIITILLILILPLTVYLVMTSKSDTAKVNAQGNNLPTMKVYTSTMCLDCQKMKGVVKEIEPEYKNKINIISINALDNRKSVQDEIKKYGIVLVPTIIYINSDGTIKNKTEGYIPKEELIKEIESTING
jgi:thiol-disulfide isomerase/thioredoxin